MKLSLNKVLSVALFLIAAYVTFVVYVYILVKVGESL